MLETVELGTRRVMSLLARRMKIALRASTSEMPTKPVNEDLSDRITTPGTWAEHVSHQRWMMYRHHAALDRELVALATGENLRLIVMEPPRHGKSEHGSRYFPSWYL